MAKSSTINELSKAYQEQKSALTSKARPIYAKRGKKRWHEVVEANHRKGKRKAKRARGVRNRLGCRKTAAGRVALMIENDMWAQICRNNRRLQAAQPVFNGGKS